MYYIMKKCMKGRIWENTSCKYMYYEFFKVLHHSLTLYSVLNVW